MITNEKGFSFIQSIFEREFVFYDEKCQVDCARVCDLPTSTICSWNMTCMDERVICDDVKMKYSSIFAVFAMTASFSGIVFEPIGRLTGLIGVR